MESFGTFISMFLALSFRRSDPDPNESSLTSLNIYFAFTLLLFSEGMWDGNVINYFHAVNICFKVNCTKTFPLKQGLNLSKSYQNGSFEGIV